MSSLGDRYQEKLLGALNIYLENSVLETNHILLVFRSQIRAVTFFPVSNSTCESNLKRVVEIAERVHTYIENCLDHKHRPHLLEYKLSALGAAQESLVSALALCRSGTDESHNIQLYNCGLLRAKLIINELIAVSRRDSELSVLWMRAAERVHRQGSLKCLGNTNNTIMSKNTIDLAQSLLSKAKLSDKRECECEREREEDVQRRISLHYRRAAACTILGENRSHKFAAETYQNAANFIQVSSARATTSTLNLWQTAVASLWLAADTIATHADEISAKNDNQVILNIARAKQLAKDAEKVPALESSIREWGLRITASAGAIALSRDPYSAPVLPLLMQKQQQVHHTKVELLRVLLTCESQTDVAMALERSCAAYEVATSDLQIFVHKIGVLLENARCYRAHAASVIHNSHATVRHLLGNCWMKAADQVDFMLQQSPAVVKNSVVQKEQWDQLYDVVFSYVYIAENVMGSVVEYLDKARGAEAGEKYGRDPREAQMWRKAAYCQIQKAEIMYTALINSQKEAATRIDFNSLLKLCVQPSEETVAYLRAADFFYRADRHNQMLGVNIYAQQISKLYTRLGMLSMQKYSLESDSPVLVDKTIPFEDCVLDCTFEFIAMLSSPPVGAEHLDAFDRSCEYGHKYLQAVYAKSDSVSLWKDAFECCFKAKNLLAVGNEDIDDLLNANRKLAVALALAALYGLGATAIEQSRRFFSLACARATKVLKRESHESLNDYNVALAERILVTANIADPMNSLSGDPLMIPMDLQQLLPDLSNKEAVFHDMLQEHAGACCLEVECTLASDIYILRVAAWKDAEKEVSDWISHLMLRAQHYCELLQTPVEETNLLLFYKLSVSCYVAFAKSAPNSAVSDSWSKAVAMCRQVVVRHLETSTLAIERCARAAHAVECSKKKLSVMWEEVASAALNAHENIVSASASADVAWCKYRQKNCAAYVYIAEQKGLQKLASSWRKASLKWRAAAQKGLLAGLDSKKCKDNVQPEVIEKIKSDAEHLEKEAEMVAKAPADSEKGIEPETTSTGIRIVSESSKATRSPVHKSTFDSNQSNSNCAAIDGINPSLSDSCKSSKLCLSDSCKSSKLCRPSGGPSSAQQCSPRRGKFSSPYLPSSTKDLGATRNPKITNTPASDQSECI